MGEVIRATADPEEIVKDARHALRKATDRGGEVAAAAKLRLEGPLTGVAAAETEKNRAHEVVEAAISAALAIDTQEDVMLGTTRDEMHNTLGRPASSPALTAIFGGGLRTFTEAPLLDQHIFMSVLATRIDAADAAPLQARKVEWAQRVRDGADRHHRATEPVREAEALETVALAGHRAVARSCHVGLTRLKRDLKSLEMTEAQIHEIIPDRPRPEPKGPAGGGPGGEASSGA
ncbi:MAG: hypothetical protein HYV63_25925 [Candidatus Schekmanbacteria bacterium]|nr:hypothetical protein [Candidatus Schekmanbacteria bacterium]